MQVYRLTASKGLTFIKKWKWWIYNIFASLCIFDGFLNCWECFFYIKLTNPCRHDRTFQLVSQQSLASINNKNLNLITKRPPVATTGALVYRAYLRIFDPGSSKPTTFLKTAAFSHHCPLRHPAPSLGHWYTGVYLRIFYPGPSNPPPSWALLPRWPQAVYRVSNGRPHLQLYRRRLHSLFIIVIWEYGQKRCVIWRKLAFGHQINLEYAICWMRYAGILAYECAVLVYCLTASKGLKFNNYWNASFDASVIMMLQILRLNFLLNKLSFYSLRRRQRQSEKALVIIIVPLAVVILGLATSLAAVI